MKKLTKEEIKARVKQIASLTNAAYMLENSLMREITGSEYADDVWDALLKLNDGSGDVGDVSQELAELIGALDGEYAVSFPEVKVNNHHNIELIAESSCGTLIAYTYPDGYGEHTHAAGVSIEKYGNEVDLCMVICDGEEIEDINLIVWDNPYSEDYTAKVTIEDKDFKEAFKEEAE